MDLAVFFCLQVWLLACAQRNDPPRGDGSQAADLSDYPQSPAWVSEAEHSSMIRSMTRAKSG